LLWGIGFYNLYVESSVAKIESLICHINKTTLLGETMKTNLNWVQLHSGFLKPFFKGNKFIDYIQDNWFLEIRKFVVKCNATIIIKSLWQQKSIREGDRMIVRDLMDHSINRNQRIVINNWRIYYKVNNIAEIINYAGNAILPQFMNKSNAREFTSLSSI
jgi:sulfur carrier protein ThiS